VPDAGHRIGPFFAVLSVAENCSDPKNIFCNLVIFSAAPFVINRQNLPL